MNKILVVAVHPDDETLGCGGTLLKHKADGDEIYWLILTTIKNGYKNWDLGFSKEVIKKREYEIKRVAELYNFDGVYKLEFPTMRIDEISMSNLIKKISDIFLEVKPNVIYLPFKDDVHSDHRKVFEATFSCTKSFRYPFIKQVYMMETLSETEFAPSLKENSFVPNVFVDITQFLEKKIQIMKVFKSEIKEHPFPRSVENIKALAIFRGATAGVKYAESFMLLKEIR
jgi:LmbE family N-acetylglucosaminyl deacetylase